MRITNATVRVVAPPVARHTWAHDLPEQYMTMTLVNLRTDAGIEGIGCTTSFTAFDFDRTIGETLRPLLPILIGADPLQREHLWRELRSHTLPVAWGARSAIDLALWDILGKVAGLPLYQLLGGERTRILSYASTPLLADVPAYLELIDGLVAQGFRAVKLHAWGIPERDLELCRAVRQAHPSQEITLMFDAEGNYDFAGALSVALQLETLGFRWLEAPLPDTDLDLYRELTRRTNLQIIPAGNWILDPSLVQQAIVTRTWGATRVDAGTCGGITTARKILALAEAAGMTCELQSWSYTVQQAANLHLMCAFSNCTFFEQPVPYDAFEFGAVNPIRTERDGYVYAPQSPGLGIELDRDMIQAATIFERSNDPALT